MALPAFQAYQAALSERERVEEPPGLRRLGYIKRPLSASVPALGARTIWLQRVATLVVVAALVVLARQAAMHSIDFPVYHRAAQQVLVGNYELYPPEAYGGQPHPSQGFRYAPAIAFLFFPLGWFSLETAALLFYGLKLAALWWVGRTIAHRMGASDWGRRGFIVSFLVVGGYVVEELHFGNAHFFVWRSWSSPTTEWKLARS